MWALRRDGGSLRARRADARSARRNHRAGRPILRPGRREGPHASRGGARRDLHEARRARRLSGAVGAAAAAMRGTCLREAPRCVAPAAARAGGQAQAGAEPRRRRRRAARPRKGGGPGWREPRDEARERRHFLRPCQARSAFHSRAAGVRLSTRPPGRITFLAFAGALCRVALRAWSIVG